MNEKEKFWSDTPEAEEQRQALVNAAEQVQVQISTKARTDAISLIHATPDEFWEWWGGLPRADDLNRREIVPPSDRYAIKGGVNNRGKSRKKNIKKKRVEPWVGLVLTIF